jgi:hypothetical protein
MKEVYLIGCHVENDQQEQMLRRLVSHLIFFKKDFVLVSHTLLPEDVIAKSVGFIYDKSNPIFQSWDIPNSNHWNFYTKDWRIASKYILYGASPYYHVGVLRLLLNGIKYIKTLDYDVVHWIEYDMFPDFDRANENVNLIAEGNQFVFHGLGSFFSFDAKIIIQPEFLNSNNEVLLNLLKQNDYVAELVTTNCVFEKPPLKIFDVLKNSGEYSQNFDKVPIHWSLFTEQNNDVHIFLLNKKKRNVIIEYKYNDKIFYKELIPEMYYKVQIGFIDMNNMVFFEIKVDGEVYVNINWMGEEFYKKLIKETRTWNYT